MEESTVININSKGNKYIQQHSESFDYNVLENNGYTQEVQSIDINTKKTWIAYITKHKAESNLFSRRNIRNNVKWFLTISQFSAADTNVDRYSFDITEAYVQEMPQTCMFLSISPDGRRVAISFANVNDYGNINKNPSHNEDCLVYKLKKSKTDPTDVALKLDKTITFQGRAVFSKDNDLMLINKDVLKIYNESYHKTSWFQLETFGVDPIMFTREPFFASDYTLNPQWAWSVDGATTIQSTDPKFIITISQHIRNNILISPYKSKAHVWSIAENGARLTSILKKEDEEIMAFSSNYKFLATYLNKTGEVNVYNIKSGIFLHNLKPKRQIPDGRALEVTYIRFCLNDRYLVMAGLEKGACSSDAVEVEVVFEAWHIESEQPISSRNIKTKLTLAQNKIFSPFAMVRPPGSTAQDSTNAGPNYATSRPLLGEPSKSSRSIIKPTDSVKSYSSCGRTSRDTVEEIPEHSIYALYLDYDDVYHKTKVKTLIIDVYGMPVTVDEAISAQNITGSVWTKVDSDLPDTGDYISDIDASTVSEAKKTICYVRSYLGDKYLLQFGKRLVQLWRLPKGSTTQEEDVTHIKTESLGELLFIHAYKAPYYGFTNTFRESWSLKGKTDGREMEQSIRIIKQDNNTNDIDRIVVDIVMDQDEKTPLDLETQTSLSEFSAELFIPFKEVVTKYSKFSKNSLHLYLKSGSQALHYLYKLKNSMQSAELPESEIQKITDLFEKTQAIVLKCVKRIANNKPNEYKYFSTITGSNILAMLASFKEGRNIIYLLLKIEQLPISLFSYAKKLTEEQEKEYLSTNENALTVLIDNMSFDLYKLLFNRILSNSKIVGIGSLSALTDVLIFLQETSNDELLISSSKKLSYLTVNTKMAHILDEETKYILKLTQLKRNYIPSFRMQESHSFTEQITQYDNTLISHIEYKWVQSRTSLARFWESLKKLTITIANITNLGIVILFLTKAIKRLLKRRHSFKKIAVLCVVPLPHFLTYSDFPEDRRNNQDKNKSNDKKNSRVIPYKPESAFIRIATNQNENSVFMQGDTVFEVLLGYKWTAFVLTHFIIMYLFCIAYYISYTVGISFAREVFSYQPGAPLTDGGQIACVAITLFSILVLIIQEIRQAYESYDKILYLSSFYNWVDWATYSLSLASLTLLLTGRSNFEVINTFTTLLLWMHAILKLRILPYVGIAIETIIQLIREVGGILLIMVLVICAFTNGLITLLSHKEDAYFQEQYEGTLTYPDLNESDTPNLSLADSSTGNDFSDVFNTFTIAWFFMFGVWDPITGGDAGDNKTIKVIAILFSFIVALIFSNILIAYMNSAIEDVKSRGKKACISHYAATIAETEQLWCIKRTKYKRKNNPTYIYYIASEEDVKEQEEDLGRETQKLFKKLEVVYANELSKEKQSSDYAKRSSRRTLSQHPKRFSRRLLR